MEHKMYIVIILSLFLIAITIFSLLIICFTTKTTNLYIGDSYFKLAMIEAAYGYDELAIDNLNKANQYYTKAHICCEIIGG